jgi:hypothetical protein
MGADCDKHDACVQWVKSANAWDVFLRWMASMRPESAMRHLVLQRPAAAVVVQNKGAEQERLLL